MRISTLSLLDRFGLVTTLACPIFLVHGRGLAEAAIDATALGFMLRSTLAGDWAWTRQPWVQIAGLWWVWLVLCSLPVGGRIPGQRGDGSLIQALATVRFLLFAAALQNWTQPAGWPRRVMGWLIAISFAYIAAQFLLQASIGFNLFGDPRFHDGTLTGPYDKPRAAAPLSRLLFPTLLPLAAMLIGRFRAGMAGAIAILLAGIAVMVLAGQRMPLLLTGLGLVVTGLILRRLRLPMLACLALVPVLVAISALASPRSFGHLVTLFEHQMAHFGTSPYGQIYARALAIAQDRPWTGLGFDGFRTGCADPRFFHGVPPLSPATSDGGGAAICVQHAHNHYLQALTDAGIPGLVLFCLMVLAWLATLARGLAGQGSDTAGNQAWRTGLFVAVLIQEWPIASSSAFTNMPLGGWFFLLLGLGLAASAPYMQPTSEGANHARYGH